MTAGEGGEMHSEHLAPGVALRAARTAQNLSVGEVARQLRLSVAQVEALEASAFDRLPGPVFVRGFLRNYARLLKLDPEPLLRSALPALPVETGPPVEADARGEPLPDVRKARWPRYAILIVGLTLALAAYEHFFAQPSQSPAARAPDKVAVAVPAAAPLVQTQAPVPAAAVPTPAEGGGAEATGGLAQGATAGPDAPAAGTVSASPPTGTGEILLNFDGDSWVEVRDQLGSTIFSQLNRRGTEQRVTGTPPLVVTIGNAQAVRLTYNDRRIVLDPHTRNAVARLTLE